jgi:hypothetical protein
MLARISGGLIVVNSLCRFSRSLLGSIIWSKREFWKRTSCWIFRNKDSFYRISTSCICRWTTIDIVVRYLCLFENIEKFWYWNFENELRTAFCSRVKLEYHLVFVVLMNKPMADLEFWKGVRSPHRTLPPPKSATRINNPFFQKRELLIK